MSSLRSRLFLLPLPLAGMTALGYFAWREGGLKLPWVMVIGAMAGMALYHAHFGFTTAWRRFVRERNSAGLRAQLVMIAVASLAFFPLIAGGEVFGHGVNGYYFPIGVSLCLGAFLFGVGMQLGDGCGSGTLYKVGAGLPRMVITLVFFMVGSTLAARYVELWRPLPALPPVSFIREFGLWPALIGMLAFVALLYIGVSRLERARHGALTPITQPPTHWLTGPWALVAGALVLAGVNVSYLLTQGWPWNVTSAVTLWGAKLSEYMGFEPDSWTYWQGQEAQLFSPVLADTGSVLNFGLMLGALTASILAGAFSPGLRMPLRSLAAAVIGGTLLGIGGRLGTGCNIGAFFSGTVSGSLHGWVWLVFAFAGSALGVRLRPFFRLN